RPVNRSRAAFAAGAYLAVCVAVRMLVPSGTGTVITATMLIGIGWGGSRLARWPPRLIVLVGGFAAALYLNHALISVAFGPSRALIAGVILGAVCSSTMAILSRLDRA